MTIVQCSLEQFSKGRELQLVHYGVPLVTKMTKRSYSVSSYKSHPPNMVVQTAREFLCYHKQWPDCRFLFENDESFASYCKTMISKVPGPKDEVSTCLMISKSDLKPGDHIYVKRYTVRKIFGGIYSHHGIYVGRKGVRKEIINFATDVDAKVRKITECSLDDFLQGGILNRVRYGVAASEKRAKKMEQESAHPYRSRPHSDVVETAEYFRDHSDQWNEYHVLDNNCETFAIYCKTWCPNLAGQGVLSRLLPSVGSYRDWLEQCHAQIHEAPPPSYIGAGSAHISQIVA